MGPISLIQIQTWEDTEWNERDLSSYRYVAMVNSIQVSSHYTEISDHWMPFRAFRDVLSSKKAVVHIVKKIQFNMELLFQLRELVIKYSMLLDQRNINI